MKTKRCPICASKLNAEGNCTWVECPKYKAPAPEVKKDEKKKATKKESE